MGSSPEVERKRLFRPSKVMMVLVCMYVLLSGLALAWPKQQFPDLPLERLQDDPTFGSSVAFVTVIEYGDYACESCRMWHNSGVLDEILTHLSGCGACCLAG